ncbi:MAG: hypothetical protein ACOC2Z_05355 [Coleofasciculus sp.]
MIAISTPPLIWTGCLGVRHCRTPIDQTPRHCPSHHDRIGKHPRRSRRCGDLGMSKPLLPHIPISLSPSYQRSSPHPHLPHSSLVPEKDIVRSPRLVIY